MSPSAESLPGTEPSADPPGLQSKGADDRPVLGQQPEKPRAWLVWLILSVLWASLVNQLRLEWASNETYSYGFIVPILLLYLFSLRWRTLEPDLPTKTAPHRILFVGIILLAAMWLPLRLIQEATHRWRIVGWGMAFVVVGISLGLMWYRLGNRRAMHLAFPVAFIFTAVPWLSVFEGPLTQYLMRADARIASFALNWLGVSALQLGNVIQTASGRVGVNEACSGIRSIQITLMISLFLGELYRFSVIRRLVLVFSVILVALVCNVGRTFTLAWISTQQGNTVMEKWHDSIGFAVLAASLGALWTLAFWMNAGRSEPEIPSADAVERKLDLYPWPQTLLLCLACWLVFAETGTEAWYRVHEFRVYPPMWSVQWPTGRPGFQKSGVGESISKQMKYSEAEQASWLGEKGTSWSAYFFRWHPGPNSASLARAHNPEVCMPATGLRLVLKHEDLVFKVNDLAIPFVHYVFQDSGRPLHVWWCVWNEASSLQRDIDPRIDSTSYTGVLKDVLRGQRNLGQQVLEIALAGESDPKAANAALVSLLPQLIKQESMSEWVKSQMRSP